MVSHQYYFYCKLLQNWIENNCEWIDRTVKFCGKSFKFQNHEPRVQFIDSNEAQRMPLQTNNDWLSTNQFKKIETLQRFIIIY